MYQKVRKSFFLEEKTVIIKYEDNVKKEQPKFKNTGCVSKVLSNNTYLVLVNNKELKRHASQLKLICDQF